MRRDKVLIEEFLRGYNDYSGTTFRVTKRPDEVERKKQAVDTIAQDDSRQKLAIEHTLLQPFVGEKDDAQRLLTMIAPLEKDASLRVPGQSIDVSVTVGAIPKGHDWSSASAKVVGWFRDARSSIPEGQSIYSVPGVGFDLTLRIDMDDSPYPEGRVYVMRSDMPEDFESVVRKALEDKLPKLAKTPADKRILLFEMDNVPRSPMEITDVLETVRPEFSDLGIVDEVWCLCTAARDTEQRYIVTRVWPRSEAEWPSFSVPSPPMAGSPGWDRQKIGKGTCQGPFTPLTRIAPKQGTSATPRPIQG